ncbi:MAG TPA: hypothetical protein VKD71_15100 [Gemmataceae bacterium]|nr:hypothetical protein [Gemmataceae bacterium]
MRKLRWICVLFASAAVSIAVVALLLPRTYRTPWLEPHPGEYDQSAQSADVSRDLKLMWETQPLRGTPDPSHGPNPHASTDRAVNAASRVFNTLQLVGKSREEVVAMLGDPKLSSDSIYNFPFWPPPKGALVYHFDSGAYGWQFNLLFAKDGRVQQVQRLWVH